MSYFIINISRGLKIYRKFCIYQSNNTFEILNFFIKITSKWITSFKNLKYKMKLKSKKLRSKVDGYHSIRRCFLVSLAIWAFDLSFSSAYLVATSFQSSESGSEQLGLDLGLEENKSYCLSIISTTRLSRISIKSSFSFRSAL